MKIITGFLSPTSGKVFVNADNDLLLDLSKHLDRYTYGQNIKSNTMAKPILGSSFATINWNKHIIKSQLVGSYNFDNIMAAICIGDYFQLDSNQIISALEEYEPKNKRSQWQKTEKNELILDAYNANPSSMEVALNSFASIDSDNKYLLLGDMLELGDESQKEHIKLLKTIENYSKSNVILIGPEFQKAAKGSNFNTFINTDAATEWLSTNNIENALILIKGSRGIALENLIKFL
jgi:UDP-N-acetylmuramoyl-tripeptide--D-alanyl-D-alanine ligase